MSATTELTSRGREGQTLPDQRVRWGRMKVATKELLRKRDGKQKEDAMGMMIIRHKVRDYGQWRPIFDEHVEMQRAAGLFNPRVYHSADSNKSEIVVVFDTEDTKKAKDFAASADLKEAMIKAGVLDTPTIYFLESID
jgi:hypothetical protein